MLGCPLFLLFHWLLHLEWIIMLRVHVLITPFRVSSATCSRTATSRRRVRHSLTPRSALTRTLTLDYFNVANILLIIHSDARASLIGFVTITTQLGLIRCATVTHRGVAGAGLNFTRDRNSLRLFTVGVARLTYLSRLVCQFLMVIIELLETLLDFSQSLI